MDEKLQRGVCTVGASSRHTEALQARTGPGGWMLVGICHPSVFHSPADLNKVAKFGGNWLLPTKLVPSLGSTMCQTSITESESHTDKESLNFPAACQ